MMRFLLPYCSTLRVFATGMMPLWLLVVWLLAGAAAAQEADAPVYEVELVAFRNLGSQASPEDWALEDTLAGGNRQGNEAEDAFAERLAASAEALQVQPLAPEQLKLAAVAASLHASRSYRPLAHVGWTQTAVPLRSGSVVLLAPLLPAASPLSGTAKLARGANLHLVLDLRLKEVDGPNYVLRESRQIKLGEKHYFDHPYFGVVATVTARR